MKSSQFRSTLMKFCRKAFFYPTICFVLFGISLADYLSQPRDGGRTVNRSASSLMRAPQASLTSQARTLPFQSIADQLIRGFSKGNSGVGASTIQQMAEMQWHDMHDIAAHLYPLFEDNPESGLDLLTEVCNKLKQTDPNLALDLATNLRSFPGVPTLERGILNEWMSATEPESVWNRLLSRKDTIDEHHLSLLSSLIQNEHHSELDGFLTWASSLLGNEELGTEDDQVHMLGKVTTKITQHVTKDTIESTSSFLEQHIDHPIMAANLARIVPYYAKNSPEETLDWLASLETAPDLHSMIIGSALTGLTEENPQMVADLLNSETFIKRFYKSGQEESDFGRENFFDGMLANYLDVMVAQDPETALANAEVFFDPDLRIKYKEWARSLMTPSDEPENQ